MVNVSVSARFDKVTHSCSAARMSADQRRELAQLALSPDANRAQLARDAHVSRPFLYRQLHCARQALEQAFSPTYDDDPVLFHLPVTRAWLHMFVLVLHLTCRASYRNIRRAMSLLFDTSISLGSIHNLLQRTASRVAELHEDEPLSMARIGAHDELFHAQAPILSGVDVPSGYCYLLEKHEHRDADTWGVALLELQDRGLALEQVIADGGKGLRAGHRAAGYAQVDYDHFHMLAAAKQMARYLTRRAERAEARRDKLEDKMVRAARDGKQGRYSARLGAARRKAERARTLSDEVHTLVSWLGEDILMPNALEAGERRELYTWLIEELAAREVACEHRIRPVRRLLENVSEDALAFSKRLDEALEQVRRAHHLKREELKEVVELARSEDVSEYWRRWSELRGRLGEVLERAVDAVARVLSEVVRVSSEVESTHTRLRRSFRERRHVSQEYLEVLRFVLNHSRLERSRVAGRQGKSPAEALCGEPLPHWLEQLGYTLFKRES